MLKSNAEALSGLSAEAPQRARTAPPPRRIAAAVLLSDFVERDIESGTINDQDIAQRRRVAEAGAGRATAPPHSIVTTTAFDVLPAPAASSSASSCTISVNGTGTSAGIVAGMLLGTWPHSTEVHGLARPKKSGPYG